MPEEKRINRTCGMCARMDAGRKYCPVTAAGVHYDKPASACGFFVDGEPRSAKRRHGPMRRSEDVCE